MRSAVFALTLLGLLLAAGEALACEGSEVIFEDKFENEDGGWSHKSAIEVKDGTLIFNLPADNMQSNLNVTFTVDNADICTEAVWPSQGGASQGGASEGEPSQGEPSILGAGLLFWGESNRTYYQFGVLNNGSFWIARKQDGAWIGTIAANVASPAIKKSPGASNTLRVDAQGNSLAFYINGTKVRELRGQVPPGGWRFGLSGDNFDKNSEATVFFTNIKVTD